MAAPAHSPGRRPPGRMRRNAASGLAPGSVRLPGLDAALRRVGDRWTPLVLVELAADDATFGELSERLDGIAPNVLTKRLRSLEADGLITSEPYQQRPLRVRYRLSDTGRQLGSVWSAMGAWGSTHLVDGGDGAAAPSHGVCGSDLELRWYCPTCDEVVGADHDEAVHL
ncbi:MULTISPECIES: winged helix-turn-helix transcriptional regulator [Candidatus Microthrix]|nr:MULTISPECIES: helix-turn-helix domain-containing protein [Microthrix]NLH67584.1 helix-turn-helix transcriptional regulator [Candidatus Microthrix parvicella]MBK7018827.1 helix-turn-helix transcriptional regulator [Candidatus Microthrix sp.]MBK7321373.1 helix-turn-helix transcriptional regulator [Candidatus Microthrix sp.]MBL0203191.1 helix-turn-helix transcriptional regulator [Candidatus Microthrix sp.]MBP6133392.1 helix-turn-helix transcriptional regulator [Candidatus Microthrix sp.]